MPHMCCMAFDASHQMRPNPNSSPAGLRVRYSSVSVNPPGPALKTCEPCPAPPFGVMKNGSYFSSVVQLPASALVSETIPAAGCGGPDCAEANVANPSTTPATPPQR